MRRFGLTLVAVFCMASVSFAAGNQPTNEKWEGNINVSRLSNYLKLTSSQEEEVANICDFFNEQMKRANSSSKKNQEKMLRNAIYGNLKLMKKALNEKQYAEYTKVLNVTLKNKGIEVK